MEVPRLCPRCQPAQRVPAGQSRHGQGLDGPAEPAAVLARRRRLGVHRQGLQPVAHAPDRRRATDAGRRAHGQAGGRRPGQCVHGPAVRHRRQGVPQLVVAADRAGRRGRTDLQGRRFHRQVVRRRGGLPARSVAPHPGDRIAAAADPRRADEEVRIHQAARIRQVGYAAAPERHGPDGLESLLVRRDGLAVLDGVPARVYRADVQPAVRQRLGSAHRQQRPEDPPRVRPVEGHARTGQPAGKEPGPESGDARRDAVAAAGSGRKPGSPQRGRAVRRQPLDRRNVPRPAQTDGTAAARRPLALVPRRTAERLYHAVHHHRFRPAAALERRHRRRPGRQVAGPLGRVDRRAVPRDPESGARRTRTTFRPRSPSTCTAAASS